MKRILTVLALSVVFTGVFAQEKKPLLRQVNEICKVERENGDSEVMVFSIPDNGQEHYYLSVGHLGVGDNIVQFNIDPLFELFIPLGDTLEEAQAVLDGLKELAKKPKGTEMETVGNLSLAYPDDQLNEPVKIRVHKLLIEKKLLFSVQRGENIRATYIPKSDITAMANGVKFYRKIHPKEK